MIIDITRGEFISLITDIFNKYKDITFMDLDLSEIPIYLNIENEGPSTASIKNINDNWIITFFIKDTAMYVKELEIGIEEAITFLLFHELSHLYLDTNELHISNSYQAALEGLSIRNLHLKNAIGNAKELFNIQEEILCDSIALRMMEKQLDTLSYNKTYGNIVRNMKFYMQNKMYQDFFIEKIIPFTIEE